jgi:pimeloyl-ACP methyl ester carboxylesterase
VHGSFVTLVLMLLLGGVALVFATVLLMAWSLVHPPRMTDGKAMYRLGRLSPGDLGLAFEDLKFQIRDRDGSPLPIAAWWIAHPQAHGRCAVLIHGYADAKVGAIAWAPAWHALGFNLLVPDLRAHGESGGAVCTAGYLERNDIAQVLDEIRAARPDETRQLVLFGISLGCAVAGGVAAQRDDITAVVMESPYADFRSTAMAQMDLLGLPGRPLQQLALALAQWLTRADYDQVRTTDLIRKTACPVLLIQSAKDALLTPDDHTTLVQAVESRGDVSQVWIVNGVEHLMAISADPPGYRQQLQSFLEGVAPTIAAGATNRS